MTRKESKGFSMAHWEAKVKNGGQNLDDNKLKELGIFNFKNHCGYCEKYSNTKSKTLSNCAKCPIRPKVKNYNNITKIGCDQDCHPYYKWALYKTSGTAQRVLTLIEKS